jgi:ABC-type Fe3+/spermidine/putrescine transport system ATPase subunit
MTSAALGTFRLPVSTDAHSFAARLLRNGLQSLDSMTTLKSSPAPVSGFVLLSLGNPNWTYGTVDKVRQMAADQYCSIDWFLLDSSEAVSLSTLHGLDVDAAARVVAVQLIRTRELLERAGVALERIHLASELRCNAAFDENYELVLAAYARSARFSRSVRNQVFTNLQPKLRRVGVTSNRDPRLEPLVDYLLRELALKATLAGDGMITEFALKPEMPVWRQLTGGEFADVQDFRSTALRHQAVAIPDEVPALVLEGICVAGGRDRATAAAPRPNILDNVSLTADGITALIGPSGAGKTTLLRAIAGHVPATGSVVLDGIDVSRQPTERRGIATVFQDFGLFPHLTGLGNAVEGGRRRSQISKHERLLLADEQLRELNVAHCADRLPRFMSGGEQQRVAIARALMADPNLLLLDEPTAALDQMQREALQDVLRRLRIRRPELPILLVSHDLEFAFAVADYVGVMDAGRLLTFGEPGSLISRPGSVRAARILGDFNVVPGDLLEDGSFASGMLSLPCNASAEPLDAGHRFALVPRDGVILDPPGEGGSEATIASISHFPSTIGFSLRTADGTILEGRALRRAFPEGLTVGSTARFAIDPRGLSFVQQ